MESPLSTLSRPPLAAPGIARGSRLRFAFCLLLLSTLGLPLAGCGNSPPPETAKPAPPPAPVPTASTSNADPAASPKEDMTGPALTLDTPKPDAPTVEEATETPPEKKAGATDPAPLDVTEADAPKKPAPKAAEKPVEPRKTLDGRWIVVLSRGGNDFYVWMVDISNSAGEAEGKLIGTSRVMGSSVLKSTKVEGDRVTLAFEADGTPFDFTAKLVDGVALGAVGINKQDIGLARLEATNATSMREYNQPKPAAGAQELVKGLEEGPKPELFREFLKSQPDSPLALDAYRMLLELTLDDSSEEDVRKLVTDYTAAAAKWDERVALETRIQAAGVLANAKKYPDFAMELLDAVEKGLDDSIPAPWKLLTKMRRGQTLLAKGDTDAGIKLYTELHEVEPFNAEITLALAEEARKADKVDVALPLYAELAVIPTMERAAMRQLAQASGGLPSREQLPSAIARDLYSKKNGSEDGYEAFLDGIYEKALHSVAKEKVAPRGADGGTRVVLCELFTGAECPPCVGADVATTGLEATYAKSEVIVLRYHQHIPGPDPLANPQSQQRFEMYQGEGTPTLIVNGRPIEGAGGFMDAAGQLYTQLREAIDPVLAEKVGYKIDLQAEAKDGTIALSASVPGIESLADVPKSIRLVLVLAEDKVKYAAGNGIRLHEMVVRSMPAGAEGLEPKDGKLEYTGEISLDELKQSLLKYLVSAEGEFGNPFQAKPLELAGLHVVAILQDSKSGEVYQTAAVPVTGSLATKFDPKAAAPPAQPKAESDDE